MAKKIITLAIIASGFDAFSTAFATDAKQAAQDVLDIIAEKDAAIEKLTVDKKSIEDVNDSLQKEIEKLSSTVELAGKSILTFNLSDKNYGFKFHKMNHKGKQITSDDVVANIALQKELVDMQSGMIKEL